MRFNLNDKTKINVNQNDVKFIEMLNNAFRDKINNLSRSRENNSSPACNKKCSLYKSELVYHHKLEAHVRHDLSCQHKIRSRLRVFSFRNHKAFNNKKFNSCSNLFKINNSGPFDFCVLISAIFQIKCVNFIEAI